MCARLLLGQLPDLPPPCPPPPLQDPACIYLAMEYCEGGDLFKTMLMKGGLLDEYWVCVEVSARGPAA